ncbi:uncharacterized protein Dwil_GK15107 [Drosophila willistoni]|uniref:EGF-like domain-containing protein n=1 Tax=Drosophila willistoni TaxID=7260 RepID=A0A0Q9WQ04_DROWI|nr:uncharacterized protein Dwil_GK15107 [Drosophila willistoni]
MILYCAAPEKCKCKHNYEGDDCHPICDNCGKFGYCQNPGSCACIHGYKRNNDSGNCEPICSVDCSGNRYCASPDKCECKPNYEGDDCHPICDNCGEFGYCQNPGSCACIHGYKRNNDSGNCEPICSVDCSGNRYCASPDKCECKPNYEGDDCHPICDNCGEFGYCQNPGSCACIHGYKRNNDSGNCEPICSVDCSGNWYCASPDKCECKPNYEGDDCHPICDNCGEEIMNLVIVNPYVRSTVLETGIVHRQTNVNVNPTMKATIVILFVTIVESLDTAIIQETVPASRDIREIMNLVIVNPYVRSTVLETGIVHRQTNVNVNPTMKATIVILFVTIVESLDTAIIQETVPASRDIREIMNLVIVNLNVWRDAATTASVLRLIIANAYRALQ